MKNNDSSQAAGDPEWESPGPARGVDGNLEQVWDANHPRASHPHPPQRYQYDPLNRMTSVTQPWTGAGGATAVTSYAYDALDHLTAVTDAEANTTTYEYSDRDLMTEQTSPVSGVTTWREDPVLRTAYDEAKLWKEGLDELGLSLT